LRQSLLEHYPRLLGRAENREAVRGAFSVTRPATPQDYLEKVFQVPFNLQPMARLGFEALVKRLLPTTPAPAQPAPGPQPSTSPSDKPSDEKGIDDKKPGEVPPGQAAPIPDEKPSPSESVVDDDKLKRPEPAPQRLMLSEKEVRDIMQFQPLFETPRAVKRLANTYCLIRVGVEEADWGAYIDSLEYRVPMFLLAVSSAFPSLAGAWLSWLREALPPGWHLESNDVALLADKHADIADRAEWDRMARCLNLVPLQSWIPPTGAALQKWAPRVARYTF
jgi:hypothetical protein